MTTMTTVSYANATYDPTYLVHQVHNLPHLDGGLHPVSNEFNISADSTWNGYTQSLFTLPYIIFSVIFLSLIFFQLCLCCRCCFKQCSCGPGFDVESIMERYKLRKYFGSITYLKRGFVIFAILALISDQFLIYGNDYLSTGFREGGDSFSFFTNTVQELDDNGNAMLIQGGFVTSDVNAAVSTMTCPLASQAITYIQQFNASVDDYLSIIDPLPGKINTVQNDYDNWINIINNIILWSFYSCLMVSIVPFVVGYRLQSKFILQFAIFWAISIVTCFVALCTVEMVVLVRAVPIPPYDITALCCVDGFCGLLYESE